MPESELSQATIPTPPRSRGRKLAIFAGLLLLMFACIGQSDGQRNRLGPTTLGRRQAPAAAALVCGLSGPVVHWSCSRRNKPE